MLGAVIVITLPSHQNISYVTDYTVKHYLLKHTPYAY
jgi:hypothetical protein